MAVYIPKQGDIVWLEFDPQKGHEQAGHRPALVLSATEYNRKTELMLCCPLTNQTKGYPFEVKIQEANHVSGVVLADQIKSLDWKARNATKKAHVPHRVLVEVIAKANVLLTVN